MKSGAPCLCYLQCLRPVGVSTSQTAAKAKAAERRVEVPAAGAPDGCRLVVGRDALVAGTPSGRVTVELRGL